MLIFWVVLVVYIDSIKSICSSRSTNKLYNHLAEGPNKNTL